MNYLTALFPMAIRQRVRGEAKIICGIYLNSKTNIRTEQNMHFIKTF